MTVFVTEKILKERSFFVIINFLCYINRFVGMNLNVVIKYNKDKMKVDLFNINR